MNAHSPTSLNAATLGFLCVLFVSSVSPLAQVSGEDQQQPTQENTNVNPSTKTTTPTASSPGPDAVSEGESARGAREVGGQIKPPIVDDDLAVCLADKDKLAGKLLELVQSRTRQSTNGLAACEAKEEVNRRTNIVLLRQINALKSQLETSRVPAEDLAELQSELDQANQAVVSLRARLAKFGISPTEGFSYLDDDAVASAITGREALKVANSRDLPRLDASKCQETIDWMNKLQGNKAPLLLQAWVWQDEALSLCSKAAGNTSRITGYRAGDEAHLVIFK